ncbi:hypothetical protein Peur_047772 [Populus x canadensis]
MSTTPICQGLPYLCPLPSPNIKALIDSLTVNCIQTRKLNEVMQRLAGASVKILALV